MKKKNFYIQSILIIFIILIICSCSRTQPSRFYILNSISESDIHLSSPKNTGLIVGIGPVDIPDYLQRPNIVTRTRKNSLMLAEYDKWAGSLKHDIPLILAENLSIALNTDHVFIYPWKTMLPVKYQVKIEIIRFDAEPEKQASLTARWLILGQDGQKPVKMKKSTISLPVIKKGYEAIVAAQSQALGVLSLEIANEINSVEK
ncbi:ABC-type transport auxiliary lipoprotein component domain-containing protein [Desulfonema limicola]|uniref:ABC-type transport auxiliary lipoprotein component domain-containing protein n=1 Tax=Desulfonema limicola TaxID=45656 RepID=A0A975BAW2_9BACT|nr:PqiC family protein [Desulfonema limicola]QTA81951.1 ABC-type transport auxiliary lipoprotein component domain-containing protein [Desulfonema limicola]